LRQLSRVTSELQRNAMSLRMVPIRGLFQKMSRLVRDLGSDPIAVRLFHPDVQAAPHAYFTQYPDFGRVLGTLRALAASGEVWPRLELSNLPWCAWDGDGLEALDVTLIGSANLVQHHAFDACAACPAKARCAGVHPAYFEQHAAWTPDMGRVAKALAHQEAKQAALARDLAVVEAPAVAWWTERVSPDADLCLSVEPVREGAGYFFRTEDVGAFYRGALSDPDQHAAFQTALRAAVRDLRAAATPDRDAVRARLEQLIAEIRG
jgi:hypothetical protein